MLLYLLVSHKDLEARHHLCERNATVPLPLFHGLDVLNVDNKVLIFALVVDFDLAGVSAGHGGWSAGGVVGLLCRDEYKGYRLYCGVSCKVLLLQCTG